MAQLNFPDPDSSPTLNYNPNDLTWTWQQPDGLDVWHGLGTDETVEDCVVSETAPTHAEGKGWYKPSTNLLYISVSNAWVQYTPVLSFNNLKYGQTGNARRICGFGTSSTPNPATNGYGKLMIPNPSTNAPKLSGSGALTNYAAVNFTTIAVTIQNALNLGSPISLQMFTVAIIFLGHSLLVSY